MADTGEGAVTRVRIGLVVALVTSLGANGYLLVIRSPRANDTTSAPERVVPRSAAPRREGPQLPTSQTPEHDLSKLDRATLEQRLADAEAHLNKLLPLSERWAHGLRSSPNEARVRPFLDKVFERSSPSDKPAYDVECRDDVCKISVLDQSHLAHDWMAMLQGPEGMGLFWAHSFGGDGVFARLRDRETNPTLRSSRASLGQ